MCENPGILLNSKVHFDQRVIYTKAIPMLSISQAHSLQDVHLCYSFAHYFISGKASVCLDTFYIARF